MASTCCFSAAAFSVGKILSRCPQVIVRHSEDGLVIGHIADDTGHIDKPSQFAGPLAAVSGDNLISAALTGPHQRRLIDSGGLDRLH